ncbi:DUF3499 domain-containing protein [Streptomyces griseus]|nr:DUF3499 domain-containing protein [Streptomyces griseus]
MTESTGESGGAEGASRTVVAGRLLRCAAVFLPGPVPRDGRVAFWDPLADPGPWPADGAPDRSGTPFAHAEPDGTDPVPCTTARLTVLGPLATYAEPHCYDLCAEHSERLTAPRGWEVVRLSDGSAPAHPSGDDLEALANAVREAARPPDRGTDAGGRGPRAADPVEVARRGHLRVLRSPDS